MIDTDETGQKKLLAIREGLHSEIWTPWEEGFIAGLLASDYKNLSSKQKTQVGRLWDKWVGK